MSVVEDIKDRLDLIEIIGRAIQLQKAGRNFKGLCPFHQEKTPSFFVFPDGQRWHCFGCGKGGDVFTFVMEHEGWDFHMALEELGRLAGVEIRPLTPDQAQAVQEEDRLRGALAAAAQYFHTLLRTSPQAQAARDYLKRRGFKQKTVEQFQLGYSLRAWDALRAHLLGQGYTIADMIQAGLLVEKEEGGTYDRFRDRLMIPIHDRRGRVIAFGGRVLNPEDEPKYMNSPQTPVFDKSAVLFGLDLASQAIRQADAAIIVEGYMDVMIPYQEGYANIVAPMGTALTEAHLKQLQRLTRTFILALDPDAAGVAATLRGLETARETLDRQFEPVFDPRGLIGYEGRLNADIRVLALPAGQDPDELILANPKQWQDLLTQTQPIVRFYFEQLLQQENPNEPKGKARIVDAMLPLLRDISNSVERDAYVQEIALRLGVDARMLLDRMRARERVEAVQRQTLVTATGAAAHRAYLPADLESHALNILFHFPEICDDVDADLVGFDLEPLSDEDFTLSGRLLWEAWAALLEDVTLELEDVLPPDLQEQVRRWLRTPLAEDNLEPWERDLLRTILVLRERRVRAMHQQVLSLLMEAQAEGEKKPVHYLNELNVLHELLNQIQQGLARVDDMLMKRRK